VDVRSWSLGQAWRLATAASRLTQKLTDQTSTGGYKVERGDILHFKHYNHLGLEGHGAGNLKAY
jgi:hypothetical protein